jgi:putative transposase
VAFRETLAVELAALALPSAKPVRLWVVDEMRYGLQPVTRRVWSLRGERPVCPVRPGYKWGYVYGALEVEGQSGAQFLYCPTVNLDCSRRFLHQIATSDPAAIHVVLWDRAGFHPKDQAQGQPANMRLLSFPPYSPDLNPIEKLWDLVKDRLCNQPYASLQALEAVLTDSLRPFWQTPDQVSDLIGQGWLRARFQHFLRKHST